MRSHVIDIGPNSVRRLCCGGAIVADSESQQSAFDCIDDAVALIDSRPVAVPSLWQKVLESISCGASGGLTVVHPSWWSSSRIDVITTAAPDGAEIRTRSWLLNRAALSDAVIIEIADDFVVITGAEVRAESRRRDHREVVGAVARCVPTAAAGAVVIDAPAAVQGARTLATSIANEVLGAVVVVDDIRFRKLAAELKSNAVRTAARRRWPLAALTLLAAVLISAGPLRQHAQPRSVAQFPTTVAVEGRVAVEVPIDWLMRRVITGPGSARLQFTSPVDPEVALHMTQSRVAVPGLDATADFLRRAIDAAPDGAFVDFNPADRGGGRPVVTYREVRTSHDIRWTVWVDNAIRISIGCQTRSGHVETISAVCELAVRSARALN